MAQLKRSTIVNNISNVLGLQSSTDKLPVEVNDKLQAVVEVGVKTSNLVRAATGATTSDVNIYTTPTDKDFYLTYFDFRAISDATADCSTLSIQVVIDGVTRALSRRYPVPATAQAIGFGSNLAYPLKIDRGTIISLNGTFTVGTFTKSGAIAGFILE